MDNLECQCGKGNWVDDPPYCKDCGTEDYVKGRTFKTKHRARKIHVIGNNINNVSCDVLPGDLYERSVTFGYYPGGAFTLKVTKRRLEKGPNWIAHEVMTS